MTFQPAATLDEMLAIPVDTVLDGSLLEGGGQILRNSVALAALLHKSLRIERIRAGRAKPGLKAQHLCGLELIADIRAATLYGGVVNSGTIVFVPPTSASSASSSTASSPAQFHVDVMTAGSVCLLVQVSLPVLLFERTECQVTMIGGTNATGAPQVDYFTLVLAPMLQRMRVEFTADVVARGYFPMGKGEVMLRTTPIDRKRGIAPITLTERGHVNAVYIRSFTAGKLPARLAREMSTAIEQRVRAFLLQREPATAAAVQFTADNVVETQCVGNGCGTIVVAYTSTGCRIAASGLVERNQRSDVVAAEVATKLIEELTPAGACTDEYLQDQLIIFMALAAGKSQVRTGPLSLHTRTALHFVGQLTDAKFEVTAEGEQQNLIECEGISFGM
jgi:RNA 3'-terminal phosphate cyclase (ATP)